MQTGMVLKNKLDEKYSYEIRGDTSVENKTRTKGLKQYLPILSWLPHYKAEWLRFDIIAALSVWALLVPQGIAYSSIAGVPAQYGLYAALGALLGYAFLALPGR